MEGRSEMEKRMRMSERKARLGQVRQGGKTEKQQQQQQQEDNTEMEVKNGGKRRETCCPGLKQC